MKFKAVTIIFVLLVSPIVSAEDSRGLPEKLFGIKLGAKYDIGNPFDKVGNIPIKKFAGVQRFLGRGIHYYFEPKKEYKIFKYIEYRKKPDDKYFRTSFRLYLLPIIPATIKNIKQLESTTIYWEVGAIEWSDDKKEKDDAYYWAMDLCKTFKVDIGIEPEIIDYYDIKLPDIKLYECTFSAGNREFKVTNFPCSQVQLNYSQKVFDEKNEAIDIMIRKLQIDEIRPY